MNLQGKIVFSLLSGLFLLLHPLFADYQGVVLGITNKPLKNPGSGLCFMPGLNSSYQYPAWLIDLCTTAYFRIDWQDLMDDKGNYILDKLDAEVFSTYRKRGLRLAFRVMAADIHSQRADPFSKFLVDRDRIPVVAVTGVYGQKQREPVFWNADYIREHGRLMEALGAYVDAHPDVDFVDFGGMGEWGEMHLGRWTQADLDQSGYSQEKYLKAVFAMMEQMDRFLPRTRKAFCVAPLRKEMEPVFAVIVDRAVRRGWWLRSDGCSAEGPPSYTREYFRKFVSRTGLIFEPSGGINRGYSGESVPVGKYFDGLLPYRPSILNLMGMWDLSKLDEDGIRTCADAARKIGYRFAFTRCEMPFRISLDPDRPSLMPVRIVLSNSGVSYYYGSGLYKIRVLQDEKIAAETVFFPLGRQISEIGPSEASSETFMVELPAGLPAKPLTVRLALLDTADGLLDLANSGARPDRFVQAGIVRPSDGKNDRATIFRMSGNEDNSSVQPAAGIVKTKTKDGWLLEGTSKDGWNYACASSAAIKPNRAYVMRIRLRAWKGPVADSALFFKFGIHRKNWEWIANVNSAEYDFSKEGSWQDLSISYLPSSPDEAQLMFCVEKGRTAPSSVKAEISSWTVEEIGLP